MIILRNIKLKVPLHTLMIQSKCMCLGPILDAVLSRFSSPRLGLVLDKINIAELRQLCYSFYGNFEDVL